MFLACSYERRKNSKMESWNTSWFQNCVAVVSVKDNMAQKACVHISKTNIENIPGLKDWIYLKLFFATPVLMGSAWNRTCVNKLWHTRYQLAKCFQYKCYIFLADRGHSITNTNLPLMKEAYSILAICARVFISQRRGTSVQTINTLAENISSAICDRTNEEHLQLWICSSCAIPFGRKKSGK